MTGIAVGGLLGAGLFCLWWSCWAPPARTRSGPAPGARLRHRLVQADLASVSPAAFVACCLLAAGCSFLVVLAVSTVPAVAACFAVMAGWLPVVLVRGRAARREQARRDLWPDVVDNLASGVRAGLSLPEALGQVGLRGPEPLRPAFLEFARDHAATGRFEDALDRLKARLADPVADRLCEALRITREVGGSDIGRLLRSLSAFLREDARTRAELEARQSWTVYAARLAVAAPWLVLALLASRPESVAAYREPAGTAVLLVGGVVSVVAYRLMIRIGRLPQEGRVLTGDPEHPGHPAVVTA
jgi:tight adherence protein B